MLTITVANATPETLAEVYQHAGLSGTAWRTVGFGAWGTEPGARVEFGAASEHERALTITRAYLAQAKEECAYVAPPNGAAYLLYADGREERVA